MSSKPIRPFANDCWVIRRKYSGGMYRINKHCVNNTLRPAVVAFQDKNKARGFLKMIRDVDARESLKQPYEVVSISFEDLCTTCFERDMSVAMIDLSGSREQETF